MPTTTRAVLRQRLSEAIGDYYSLTSDAAGSANTIVDEGLLNLDGGGSAGYFKDWWALITASGHAAIGEERRVSVSTATSPPTLTVQSPFSSALGSAAAYELHRYQPSRKHTAISRALEDLFPYLYLPIRDETLIVDNLGTNMDFETFANSAFTGWSNVLTPTVAQETSRVFHGSNAASLVANAAGEGLGQSLTVNQADAAGRTISFEMMCYTTSADGAYLTLFFGTGNSANTVKGSGQSTHTGDDEWQRLKITATVPVDATEITLRCLVDNGVTGIFDRGAVWIRPVYRYTLPTSLVKGPYKVYEEHDVQRPGGPYYPFPDYGEPTPGRYLRLEGMGLLSRPTTESGTTEIGEPHVALVVAQAVAWLLRTYASIGGSSNQDREGYLREMEYWQGEVDRLKSFPGNIMRPLGAQLARGAWRVDEDSTSRYLLFERNRG